MESIIIKDMYKILGNNMVLTNINLLIEKGEKIGIIGGNGAGKTTLMRLIAGIYTPTSGIIKVNGKIVPILKMGIGFHNEEYLYECITLYLKIFKYEYSKDKIRKILEFAELDHLPEKTKMKELSSGMVARLGFSTAISIDDMDVLLLDEIFSVGDIHFRKKCIEEMENLINKKTRTVLLVSHNMQLIRAYSDRVIWIDEGKVRRVGESKYVTNKFERSNHSNKVGRRN